MNGATKAGVRDQGSGKREPGTIICAWCKKILGTSDEFEGVSHSICPTCKKRELEKFGIVPDEEPGETATMPPPARWAA